MQHLKRIGSLVLVVAIGLTLSSGSLVSADVGTQGTLPKLDTSIARMMQYPKFYEPKVQTPLVPESEMTRVTFSKDWIVNNDVDVNPNSIKLTFPVSWLKSAPPLEGGATGIELAVPTQMLLHANQSKNSGEITVDFPNAYFIGMPTQISRTKSFNSFQSVLKETDAIESTDSQRRISFSHDGDHVTGARGHVTPVTYSNNTTGTFVAYQEIEYYGTGNGADVVEIISEMPTSEGNMAVWFAIWDDGSWITSTNFCRLAVEVDDEIYYQFYLYDDDIFCYLLGPHGWYANDNPVTPPDDYDAFDGSSELYTDTGMDDTFEFRTNPITLEGLQTESSTWHNSTYVFDELNYTGKTSYNAWVDLDYSLDAYGLAFDIIASSGIY